MKTTIPAQMTDMELAEALRANAWHTDLIRESQQRQLLKSQEELKQSVDRLHHARRIEISILIATLIGVLVGVIGLFWHLAP